MRISEHFPAVKKLVFTLNYRDVERLLQDHGVIDTRGPDGSAFFKFQCPYHECMEGGYDLTSLVGWMLDQGRTTFSGRSGCHAWCEENEYR